LGTGVDGSRARSPVVVNGGPADVVVQARPLSPLRTDLARLRRIPLLATATGKAKGTDQKAGTRPRLEDLNQRASPSPSDSRTFLPDGSSCEDVWRGCSALAAETSAVNAAVATATVSAVGCVRRAGLPNSYPMSSNLMPRSLKIRLKAALSSGPSRHSICSVCLCSSDRSSFGIGSRLVRGSLTLPPSLVITPLLNLG